MRLIQFTVTGVVPLQKTFDRLGDGLPASALRTILHHAATPIQHRMHDLAPRAPGLPDMRDHIILEDLDPSVDNIGVEYEVGVAIGPSSEFFYGLYQEFGTIHHPAQPFARPAFDQGVGEAMNIIAVEFWAELHLVNERAA